jgi:beta-glucosidase
MPPSDFANADIDKVLNQLTTDEAILLTAGVGFWHTHCIDRLGIPAIKVWSFSFSISRPIAHDYFYLG